MRRFTVHAAWAMALSLGLGCLAGCGGSGSSSSGTGTAPSITSFTATPASITAGASVSLTGVFSGGTGVITPGNLPATSGTAVSVSPTATTTYTLTVTASDGTVATKAVVVTVNAASYKLTVDSTDPASGVAIFYKDPVNSVQTAETPFTNTYSSGTTVTLTAPPVAGNQAFSSWTGCTSSSTVTCTVTMSADTTVTANYAAPATPIYVLTVDSANPASGVAITAAPADLNSNATGTTSFTLSFASGTAVTLTAPATSGSAAFGSWTGCTSASTITCTVTMSADTAVTANYTIAPTVTVTPSLTAIGTTQPLTVTVTVSGGSGNPVPTGSVTLTSGSYTSPATTLNSSGSATITVPGGSLAAGSATLKATYTPDSASSSIYNSGASGTSAAVTVSVASQVTVTTPSTPLKATDKILGMNLASWYDVISNKDAIVSAFGKAGIKAVRWPGGSWSDDYHWATNTGCGIEPKSNDTFANFVSDIVTPGNLDLALTANYGSNTACTGGGEPSEAAAWVAEAKTLKANVTHVTVGNEVYGASWEEDLHTPAHDPATYAAAVAGSSGYYDLIKAADSSVKVGVVVEDSSSWDQDVLTNANGYYDFVEYHDYPEAPGSESDSYLVTQAAQGLTTNINAVKAEMAKWGTTVPIYVGEIGGAYTNPGKQSWSITQGLYAGQVLGEMMNDGVARLTWWIGFGNCNGDNGNDNSSLYGWQNFGGYNVFADGAGDTGGTDNSPCNYGGPIGTMSPTARAFQLFSSVAVEGEDVLTAGVTGDTADVRAYAATHADGAATAVAVFNLNETTSEPVVITVPEPTTASKVTVITYDKSIYDLSGSPTGVVPDPAGTSTWADPTTTIITSPTLPLTLTLTPWSMNVVIVE